PEARLLEPFDWITPALALMERDQSVMVGNPSWEAPDARGLRPGVERETISLIDGFALGQGFSDQAFLGRRATFSAPIYHQRCIAKIVHPAAHKAHVFEARVAAYMRHHGCFRATSLSATYVTDSPEGRSSYPPRGLAETVRFLRNGI